MTSTHSSESSFEVFYHRLLLTFMFWASSMIFIRWSFIYGMNRRINLVLFKRYSNQLWYLNRHVHAYVKMDELAKFDRNADRLENEVEKGNSLDHHRIARNNKKKAISNRKCVKTTRVCMDDGNPANSVVIEKLIFRDHFGAQLAGTVLPFKALLEKDR